MSLSKTLRNVVEVDENSAEHIQDALLDAVSIRDPWEVHSTDIERQNEVDGDNPGWTLLQLDQTETGEHAQVDLLSGLNLIQVYRSDTDTFYEPTWKAEDIQSDLAVDEASSYNVVIDAHFDSLSIDEFEEIFAHAIHVEDVGVNMLQVGVDVKAWSLQHAYRRAVNLFEATLEASDVTDFDVFHANVYGPGGNEPEHTVIDE